MDEPTPSPARHLKREFEYEVQRIILKTGQACAKYLQPSTSGWNEPNFAALSESAGLQVYQDFRNDLDSTSTAAHNFEVFQTLLLAILSNRSELLVSQLLEVARHTTLAQSNSLVRETFFSSLPSAETLVAEWRNAAVAWMACPPDSHATLERFQDSMAGAMDRYLDRMAFVNPQSLPSDVFASEAGGDQASLEESKDRPKKRDQKTMATAARDASIKAEHAKLLKEHPGLTLRAAARQLSETSLCRGLSAERVKRVIACRAG
jgi:hypothetical protein